MKPLFISSDLQADFEKNGFVKISLLTADETRQLVNDYSSVSAAHEAIGIPYITTSHSNNADLIGKVDGFLQKILAPAIDRHLINYKLLFGNFLVKMPMEGSETSPHQDITFVEEDQYVSVNIWVALQDVDEKDGAMYFLPASHRFMPTIRPTHSYPWKYENVTTEIKKHVVAFSAKAGDAFVFHHGVIHGSFANLGNKPRLAAVMAAYHAEAELLHYFLPEEKGNWLQKYSMTKNAFLSFVKNQPPDKGIFLENIQYDFHQLHLDEFKSILKKSGAKKNITNTISRFLKIFS